MSFGFAEPNMAENYAKAQRNKRDFDRTMKILDRENKMKVHLINNAKQEIGSGLLDLQSKTKNLSDTITFITTKLLEEKKSAEEQLKTMSIDRSNVRHTHDLTPEGTSEIDRIRNRITLVKDKINWLDPQKPDLKKHLNVVEIITNKKQGFGAILNRIRETKASHREEEKAESIKQPRPPPTSPKDICSLIEHFKTLPKIYPVKPKKKKPKPTVVMLEKYAEKKKERDKAMSYVTRRRLRRVEFHCDTLKDLFLTPKDSSSITNNSLQDISE